MRVSIWQQWSSNHSSSFHVVGSFATAENAVAAAAELRGILAELAAESAGSNSYEVTPLERQIRLRYAIPDLSDRSMRSGEPTLFADDAFSDDLEKDVRVMDRLVVLSSGETYIESLPHEALMARLGASGVWSETEESSSLVPTITVSCKDEESADLIYSELRMYFDSAPRPFWYLRSAELPIMRLYYAPANWLPVPWAWAAADPNAYGLNGDGSISRDGLDLAIRLQFEVFHVGLPALLRYLENCGAGQFEYRFEQRGHPRYRRQLLLYPTDEAAAVAAAAMLELVSDSLEGAESLRYNEISERERAAYGRFGLAVPVWPLRREISSLAVFEAMLTRVGRGLVLVSNLFSPTAELLQVAQRSGPEAFGESVSDFSGANRIQLTLAATGGDEARAAALEEELARYLAWVTIDKQFRSPENEARLRRFAAEHPAAKLTIPWGGDERAHAYGRVEREGAALTLTVFFRMLEVGLPLMAAYLAGHGFGIAFSARSHPDQSLVL